MSKIKTQQQALKDAANRLVKAYQEGFYNASNTIKTINPYPKNCLEYYMWEEGEVQGIKELKANL